MGVALVYEKDSSDIGSGFYGKKQSNRILIFFMSLAKNISQFVDNTLIDLGRQFRWSYLPPLMIYVAAGVSGLTGIVGVFFIKDYLNLSAAFLAGLGFWAGIPWH